MSLDALRRELKEGNRFWPNKEDLGDDKDGDDDSDDEKGDKDDDELDEFKEDDE
jgi:hypothetical protein